MKPYIEEIHEKHGTKEFYRVRTYTEPFDTWFKEDSTQRIQVFSGEGWNLQISENKPILMEIGKQYSIPRKQFYRIIKGDEKLVLRVEII